MEKCVGGVELFRQREISMEDILSGEK